MELLIAEKELNTMIKLNSNNIQNMFFYRSKDQIHYNGLKQNKSLLIIWKKNLQIKKVEDVEINLSGGTYQKWIERSLRNYLKTKTLMILYRVSLKTINLKIFLIKSLKKSTGDLILAIEI